MIPAPEHEKSFPLLYWLVIAALVVALIWAFSSVIIGIIANVLDLGPKFQAWRRSRKGFSDRMDRRGRK